MKWEPDEHTLRCSRPHPDAHPLLHTLFACAAEAGLTVGDLADELLVDEEAVRNWFRTVSQPKVFVIRCAFNACGWELAAFHDPKNHGVKKQPRRINKEAGPIDPFMRDIFNALAFCEPNDVYRRMKVNPHLMIEWRSGRHAMDLKTMDRLAKAAGMIVRVVPL